MLDVRKLNHGAIHPFPVLHFRASRRMAGSHLSGAERDGRLAPPRVPSSSLVRPVSSVGRIRCRATWQSETLVSKGEAHALPARPLCPAECGNAAVCGKDDVVPLPRGHSQLEAAMCRRDSWAATGVEPVMEVLSDRSCESEACASA
jgi:hypothetical protein